MATPSWHVPSLVGILAIVLGADVRTPERRPGIVVLHFGPSASGESERACRPEVKNSGHERTLFRDFHTADGTLLTISGHVAWLRTFYDAGADRLLYRQDRSRPFPQAPGPGAAGTYSASHAWRTIRPRLRTHCERAVWSTPSSTNRPAGPREPPAIGSLVDQHAQRLPDEERRCSSPLTQRPPSMEWVRS